MRPNELKSIIANLVKAETPIHLRSGPGQGKSDTVYQLPEVLEKATDLKWGVYTCHLSLLDAPDIKGFLVPQKTDKGPVSVYTKPDLISQVEAMLEDGYDRVLVFFDERGQSDPLVQKAVAPIILDNRIGDYFFPEGTYFISASNRVSDKAGVNKELTHLTNREIQLDFEIVIDDWIEWARGAGVPEMMLGYAMFNPGSIIQDKPPAVPGPYCTPRSFTAACRYLSAVSDGDNIPTDEVTQQVVAGSIGSGTSAEVFGFLSTREFLPTWNEVLTSPETAKIPPVERLDAVYAAAAMLITRATTDTINPVIEYAMRLNVEMRTMIISNLVKSLGSGIMNNKTIRDFIIENKTLVSESV